ncbi:hypothetical protein [Embleya sp. NBC_00896]|uniref:hypothetical protein n=1 Tax=Embleya sp. NBC_00896 TaxID=2975961 RepID=UPI003868A173|nr:hypothetical protein OG928_32060 [Embleya sp. NBC_00896]
MTIDYERFAERLTAPWPQCRTLVPDLLREFGHVEALADRWQPEPPISDSVPDALAEWLGSARNSYLLDRGLYETFLDWPTRPLQEHTVFMTEYEGCCAWGYRDADAHLPDPPVWVGPGEEWEGAEWAMSSRSVTEWLVQMAVVRVLPQYAFTGDVRAFGTTEEQGRQVRAALPALGPLPWDEVGNTFHFFGARDAIVVWLSEHDSWECPDLAILGRTEEAVHEAAARLDVELDHGVTAPARPRP